VCNVLSLLASVLVLLPSAVLAQSSPSRVARISPASIPVVPGAPDSLPYLYVLGVVEQGRTSLSVQNFGPGSVSLTTVDENNDIVSSAAIQHDDLLSREMLFGASNELTFIFEAANGTEVFRQTVSNDYDFTFDFQSLNVSMMKSRGPLPNSNAMLLTFGNPLAFDLLLTMEHQGEPVDGSGTVIRPRASITSGWLQLNFMQRLAEGDDFYASMVPKDRSDGAGVVCFMAITNWRPFASTKRARRLRSNENAAVEWAVGKGA